MNKEDRIAVDFIDPLFAVVLNVSFAQILTQPWFLDFRLVLHDPHFLHVSTLILGYWTVILSWIGYHRSIQVHPIGVKSFAGRARFFLDVLLLVSYFVLLVSYENFRRELSVLAIIFILFFAWDRFKRREWPEEKEPDPQKRLDSAARRGVTVFWGIFFIALALFYWLHPPEQPHGCEDWLVLFAAGLGTWLYRVHKQHLWWKKCLLRLVSVKANAQTASNIRGWPLLGC